MEEKKIYHVIGLMSGSSLDGLDIAYCKITTGDIWKYKIIHAKSYPYNNEEKKFLFELPEKQKEELAKLDGLFAFTYGLMVLEFKKEFHFRKIDLIASHGHTVLHEPKNQITIQLGSGQTIATVTNKPVICNFREADVRAGGQGAPLVPICDEYFFSDYHACLNIGGIANISYREKGQRIGFDICAANQLLNALAGQINLPYDNKGAIAKKGNLNEKLYYFLNDYDYFFRKHPKSLDNKWIQGTFITLLNDADCSIEDKLRTVTEHIALQISKVILNQIKTQNIKTKKYRLLITGGGAYNTFLIKRIEKLSGLKLKLPDDETIQFKEAFAMCLMGILRIENKSNFLPSVTGAKHAVSGGDIFYP
ncbi:MAG: anhydro-N-acetylmuramic acid kinase [Fimbriimonadaceae bacterium]|nr:anhydro-N-acetylmuramic acid kinase [Chitinophagales bacterium]